MYDKERYSEAWGLPLCRQIKTSYFYFVIGWGRDELDCRKEPTKWRLSKIIQQHSRSMTLNRDAVCTFDDPSLEGCRHGNR